VKPTQKIQQHIKNKILDKWALRTRSGIPYPPPPPPRPPPPPPPRPPPSHAFLSATETCKTGPWLGSSNLFPLNHFTAALVRITANHGKPLAVTTCLCVSHHHHHHHHHHHATNRSPINRDPGAEEEKKKRTNEIVRGAIGVEVRDSSISLGRSSRLVSVDPHLLLSRLSALFVILDLADLTKKLDEPVEVEENVGERKKQKGNSTARAKRCVAIRVACVR
jgi:hypothetical protein